MIDRRLIFGIMRLEGSPTQQWRLHSLEIIRGHHIHLDRRRFARLRFRRAFRDKRRLPSGHERRIGSDAPPSALPGNADNFSSNAVGKIRQLRLIGIGRLGQIHPR